MDSVRNALRVSSRPVLSIWNIHICSNQLLKSELLPKDYLTKNKKKQGNKRLLALHLHSTLAFPVKSQDIELIANCMASMRSMR